MRNDFYTIPKAAMICNVSRTTMWRWVKQGMLNAYPSPGGVYQIKENDLKTFVQEKMKHLSDQLFPQKKILIVDDDPKMIDLLFRMLSTNGYRLDAASDGFQAGRKMVVFRPDLVILDLFMPKTDGFSLCKQIKQNPDTEHVKVLAVTGFDTPENRARIMNAGADDYLAKPLGKRDILDCVDALLGN